MILPFPLLIGIVRSTVPFGRAIFRYLIEIGKKGIVLQIFHYYSYFESLVNLLLVEHFFKVPDSNNICDIIEISLKIANKNWEKSKSQQNISII